MDGRVIATKSPEGWPTKRLMATKPLRELCSKLWTNKGASIITSRNSVNLPLQLPNRTLRRWNPIIINHQRLTDVCLRPNDYTKPILCVPGTLGTQFPNLISLNKNKTDYFALILLVLIFFLQFANLVSVFVLIRREREAEPNLQVPSLLVRGPVVQNEEVTKNEGQENGFHDDEMN
ncbi:hypothetical protein GPALN_007450 [Globodera pallida]|nr:hypothetical protein GPALN_007450 [Globodera pallida]